jgi:hypothetical protein
VGKTTVVEMFLSRLAARREQRWQCVMCTCSMHCHNERKKLLGTMRCIMVIAVSERRPVAHLPLVLGMLRQLAVMAVIDTL